MRKQLAEGKTPSMLSPTLAADVADLKREFDKLQQLRAAVAEAERSNLDREQRPARLLS